MLAWALRLLKMVLVLPETAGSFLGMGVVGKRLCSYNIFGRIEKKIVQKKNADEMIILLQLHCHTWL